MENFIFTANAVIPLFLLVAAGYLIRTLNWLDETSIQQINQLCFKLLLPFSLFHAAAVSDIRASADFRLLGYMTATYLISVVVLCLIVPKLLPSRQQAGAAIHAAFRANTVLFGIPLAQNLLGAEGAVPMTILVSIMVPLYSLLGVIVLSLFADEQHSKLDIRKMLYDILRNPLIIGAAAGVIWSLLKLPLPRIIGKPIADIAACATPMAMLMLGAQFNLSSAMRHLRLALGVSAVKLILMPAVWTLAALALGFSGNDLGAVFIVHAAPTAATTAMMAANMGSDSQLAGEIVLITTACSMLTLVLGATLMRGLGLI